MNRFTAPSGRLLPPFEGNPLRPAPLETLVRAWTMKRGEEVVGFFCADGGLRSESGRSCSYGVAYCRVENATTGEVYYDMGWYRRAEA